MFIQTRFPDHYAIQLAIAQDYHRFFVTELQQRRNPPYPPYAHLIEVLTSDPDLNVAKARIKAAAVAFKRAIAMLNAVSVEVLGPASVSSLAFKVAGATTCCSEAATADCFTKLLTKPFHSLTPKPVQPSSLMLTRFSWLEGKG